LSKVCGFSSTKPFFRQQNPFIIHNQIPTSNNSNFSYKELQMSPKEIVFLFFRPKVKVNRRMKQKKAKQRQS
jgi:hypothetical protein